MAIRQGEETKIMPLRRPLLVIAAFGASLSLAGCAGAYEEARDYAAASGVVVEKSVDVPAKKAKAKKAGKKTAGKKKPAEKPAAEKDAKAPPAVGACVTYQFMGGADCEEAITKRDCYDKRSNVVDWRKEMSCAAAFLSPPEKKP